MGGSVRGCLAMGAAAVAASAIVTAPPIESASRPEPVSVAAVDLTAAASPLVVTPPDRAEFVAAREAIARLDPVALSATGDWISSAYQAVMYWASYGVDLANYALQFVPFGYLISGQVDIVYDTLVVPISSSFVYDLAIPVVNDPLNPWSYINGLAAVGSTTVVSLINAGIAEFNYFFGWLIPPLPPLPLATAAEVTAEPEVSTPAAAEPESVAEPEVVAAETKTVDATEATPAAVETTTEETPTAEETATAEETTAVETASATATPTVDTKNGVSAQGEVRTGGQTATPAAETTPSTADNEDEPTETATPSATPEPAEDTQAADTTADKPADTDADKTAD